jgi:hypothetical protein
MKKNRPAILLICAFSVIISSCSKSSDSGSGTITLPTVVLSQSTVKIGQPVFATSSGQAPNNGISWTSETTNGQVWTSSTTDTATFIFTSAGTYQVTARYLHTSGSVTYTYDSSYTNVTVTDSVFNDTGSVHCDLIVNKSISPDDIVVLTPISYTDTGLVFSAHTVMTYDHSPILNCGGNIPASGGNLECDINSVFEYACLGSSYPAPAVGIVSFTGLTIGTYNLIFKLNDKTYTGTVVVSKLSLTITWTDNSGVSISPLTIEKQ